MALRFIDSFDHYVAADLTKKWTSAYPAVTSPVIVPGAGRCGDNALFLGSNVNITKGITVAGTPANGTMGFAMNANSNLFGVNFCSVLYSGGNYAAFTGYLGPDGSLAITSDYGTQATSAPDVVRLGSWYFLEFQWHIATTASTIIVRVNEAVVINVSGKSFGRTTAPLATDWSAVRLSSNGNAGQYFDSFYVLDDVNDGLSPATHTFLGDVRVEYLRPSANGVYTDWIVNGGGTHANAVDKNAASNLTSPSISSSTVGAIDTNLYLPPSISSGSIFGAQLSILAQKDTSGPRTLASVTRAGGSNAVGTAQAPSQGTPHYLIQLDQRNPVTGAPWTPADIAAAQYGVEVVS